MEKIAVIGSMNMDYVMNVPHMPRVGETLLCTGFEMIPGGKGANQAYAAGKLGASAVMLGAVGDDGPGKTLCASLRSVGVDVSRVRKLSGVSTGSAFIQVNAEGDNSIVVSSGANGRVDVSCLEENRDVLEACGVWVFQLEIPLETVVYGIKLAKSLGKTVILDPAPARQDLPPEIYPMVDYLKPNEGEAALLAGVSPEEPERAAAVLRERGVKNVLITLGGKGAYLLDEQGRETRFPPETGIKVVDTTAAGDCFTAALAGRLAAGEAVNAAVRFAIRASGLAVSRKGAQPSIPTLEEVLRSGNGKAF